MSTVCANCGRVYDESGKLVCPHCGADVDLTHAEPSHEMSFDDPRMDDDAYRDFLADEGLGPRRKRPFRIGAFLAALFLVVLVLIFTWRILFLS